MSDSPAAVAIDMHGKAITEDVVHVEYRKTVSAGGVTWLLVIDLDNTSGAYKHTETGYVQILGGAASLGKDKVGDQWTAQIGVITRIDGTNADVAFIEAGSLRAKNTAVFDSRAGQILFPVVFSLEQSGGVLAHVATNFTELAITALNTGMTLEDVSAASQTPAVGDMVSRVERVSGSGDATVVYGFAYRTVA